MILINNMKSLQVCLILIGTIITTINSLANPGVLIQIPHQLSLPVMTINLPVQIPSIVTSDLQLSSISLTDITYNWKTNGSQLIISLPNWLVQFEWQYKKDSGLGTFVETYLQLHVDWEPNMDKNKRFQIDVVRAVLKNGDFRSKVKVHLGGGVSQTVIVEVTDIIVNHAKIIFRQALTNALIGLIHSLSDPFQHDPKIVCPVENDCIMLNTSLVSKPYVYNNEILVQINGASYPQSHPSKSELNPSQAFIRIPSEKIVVQFHERMFQDIARNYLKVDPFQLSINSTEISSITQITSQTLSMVFPKMKQQVNPIPVIFNLSLNSKPCVTSVDNEGIVSFEDSLTAKILLDKSKQTEEIYINQIKGTITAKVKLVISREKISIRLSSASIKDIIYDPKDLIARLIEPIEFEKHLPTLLQWMVGAINGELNQNIKILSFKDAKVDLLRSLYLEGGVGMEFEFMETASNNKVQVM